MIFNLDEAEMLAVVCVWFLVQSLYISKREKVNPVFY